MAADLPPAADARSITAELSPLDRYLTVWVLLAMIAGAAVSYFLNDPVEAINDALTLGHTNLLLAAGLILMIYPPLAEVKLHLLPKAFTDTRVLGISLLQNWVVGPVLMFALAALILGYAAPALMGEGEEWTGYLAGLLLVGIARCVAMVLIWNRLAGGSSEYGAALVALNTVFQIVTFGFYAWFFIAILPPLVGLESTIVNAGFGTLVETVLIYLGIPFTAGAASRLVLVRAKGEHWYENTFLPRIAPIAVVALLFTIFVMFTMQGRRMIERPLDVLWIALPLTLYFVIMFSVTMLIAHRSGLDYRRSTTLSFTAAGNNFELAIAVAIAVFGVTSPIAFATAIGPLVEVPVLIALVHVSLWGKRMWFTGREHYGL